MIPKKIHYCWFGGNPLPKMARKCIDSWKKFFPDYEIIEWNEINYDISNCPEYVQEAYELKKWAFVSDYARLQIIYENGGIYFDTDVEVIKPFGEVLTHNAFFGFEGGKYVNTGLGFGANRHLNVLQDMMSDYSGIHFKFEDGSLDQTSCPVRNTSALVKYGLKQDDSYQILENDIIILPTCFMCPVCFDNGDINISEDTISIHWYSASWFYYNVKGRCRFENRKKQIKREKRRNSIDKIKHLPNRFVNKIISDNLYNKIKKVVKR